MAGISQFTQEMADIICERIADGESVRQIAADAEMPAKSTIFKWLADHEEFSDQYARACETRADEIFDEIFDIADNAENDWMERSEKRGGGWEINGEHIQRSRLRIDARKWALARMNPKKYGDRIQHADTDGGPIKVVIQK